jgi:hypothetical protein
VDTQPFVVELGARLGLVPRHDLVTRELECAAQRRIEAIERGLQLGLGHGEVVEPAAVETLRAVAHRSVATGAHLGDDPPDGVADAAIRGRGTRERATDIEGTAEIDTSQHGEPPIVPAAPVADPGIAHHPHGSAGPFAACHAALVSSISSSDLALLSSIGAQIEEIGARITEMAERYGATPDSALASELFGAERGLFGARRFLDRARGYLEDMT